MARITFKGNPIKTTGDLPKVGAQVKAGQPFGEVESVKAVSDLYSPVAGEVIAVHSDLASQLETLGSDPYSAGWMMKVAISDEASLKKLMDAAAYEKKLNQLISESKFEKKVVKIQSEDFAKSFAGNR